MQSVFHKTLPIEKYKRDSGHLFFHFVVICQDYGKEGQAHDVINQYLKSKRS